MVEVSRIHPQSQKEFNHTVINSDGSFSDTRKIVCISRFENRADDVLHDVNLFNTGLVFDIKRGYHLMITAHPDLLSTGYMLPSTMILDSSSKDELVIPLYKFKDGEDLDLPFEAVQFSVYKTEELCLSFTAPVTGAQRGAPLSAPGYSQPQQTGHRGRAGVSYMT